MNDLIPTLPEPWTFDGYKRIYEGGRPTSLWQARAVNLTDLEEDEHGIKADFIAGVGGDLEEARDALVDALAAKKVDQ
jgi:hypothetical protein